MLTDSEKQIITNLVNLSKEERKVYLDSHPELVKKIRSIFSKKDKVKEITARSDKELSDAILSSYAAKAYQDEGKTPLKKIYYKKKDQHMHAKVNLDQIINDNIMNTSLGVKRSPNKDRAGEFYAYIFSDSKGVQPGLHTHQKIDDNNASIIGDVVSVSNPEYFGLKTPDELKAYAKAQADAGLLEDYYANLVFNNLGINESEFFDDFYAIYGDSIEEDKERSKEIVTESLTKELPKQRCRSFYNIPLKELMSYADKDIKKDIKEKDNGKSLEDYKINSGDGSLTLNYMLFSIKRLDKEDKEKDFLDAKFKYFNKIQEKAKDSNGPEKFKIAFSTINSVYRKYLKYKKK